jgi:hypothetical protein
VRAVGRSAKTIDVSLEVGKKRTFAGAVDWPGWCRSGRDEESALEALAASAPRYALALRGARLGFRPPTDASAFTVVERLRGDATTDFGAPGAALSTDQEPVSPQELRRFQALLRTAWRALDRAVEDAAGKELRKGPRGGGRSLDGIIDHVVGAEVGYLNALGWKLRGDPDAGRSEDVERTRKAVLEGLTPSVRGEIPRRGPRGGVRWPPRYFVRRVAWHVLDHAWEIEDRLI